METFNAENMFAMATTIFERKFQKSFKHTCRTIRKAAKKGRFQVQLNARDKSTQEVRRTIEELKKLNFDCDYLFGKIQVSWGYKKS